MENLSQKISLRLLLSAGGILVVLFLLIIFVVIKSRQPAPAEVPKKFISPTVTLAPAQPAEKIISVSYSIDCQIVVTTTARKIYVEKLTRCSEPLRSKISADGQYLIYNMTEIYSLVNNAKAILDVPVTAGDYLLDKKDNLAVLDNQNLIYYFIPRLFSGFPNDYDTTGNTFTNLSQNKITIPLPNLSKKYAKISETTDGLELLDINNQILYTATFIDLENQLNPVAVSGIDRSKLDWSKRLFYVDNNVYKTADLDGNNVIAHQFVCDDVMATPSGNMFTRSPDGTLLAFLINEGAYKEIGLYDFVKDKCQLTGAYQSISYQENMAFSPNGIYLAHVDNGISLYILDSKSDNQLSSHFPTSEVNPSAVTGPLVWSGDSRFIYAAVSNLQNNTPSTTSLVQTYFSDQFEGNEQNILTIPFKSLYASSDDGSNILYFKDSNIYTYNIVNQNSSLYQSVGSQENIAKIIWLRNNNIITDQYGTGNYLVDFGGENYIYDLGGIIKVFDLVHNKDITNPDKVLKGQPLSLFY